MKHQINDNILTLHIDSRIYNEAVVFKCLYWICKDSTIDISINEYDYIINIVPKNPACLINTEEMLNKIKQGLIDYKLRDIVNQETKTVRELIVAKAFAYYETEEDAQTDISDDVAINPEKIQQ